MRAPNLRRGVIGLAVLCGALAILAAARDLGPRRSYFRRQPPFTNVNGIAFDANDNVWVIGWFPTLHKPQPGWDNPTEPLQARRLPLADSPRHAGLPHLGQILASRK